MFQLIKYLQPTWYFNLSPGTDHGYFPREETISEFPCHQLPDASFNGIAQTLELAYRANKTGCMDAAGHPGLDWWGVSTITLKDEYRFARKYFPNSRVLSVLLVRIITFHNPSKELFAFWQSRGMKRIIFKNQNPIPQGFENYKFDLLKSKPLITVVIPTLNRYNYLKDVLGDLEKQDYKNFEVIIVDQSDPFDSTFYKTFKLNIILNRQEEKALWLARNTAIKQARGMWIALSEDDVRIPYDWLTNHLKCVDYFKADISSGVFFPSGGRVPEDRNFFRWSDQFATGNAFINKNVFLKTGLFDRQFEKQRMGDGEFGLRAYKTGIKSVNNPLAWCEDIKAITGGLREMGNWDAYRTKSIWSPRPVPSVLYFYRKYFGTKATLISMLFNIPPSIVPYKFKRNKFLLLMGSFLAILIMPLLIIQLSRSWIISSQMLDNSLIDKLEN